jgi:hypothetical protein
MAPGDRFSVKWISHFRFAAMMRIAALAVLASLAAGSATASGRYEGVASCAGSTCHGRAEGDGKIVRQDELRIWQEPSSRSGAHSRAFAALSSSRGQSITRALGFGNAETAPACLGCHVTPAGPRGDRFQASDGVGCESCHGPASGWIAGHYAMNASHAGNIAGGLLALDNPGVRASVCLDCHYGSSKPGQFVTHAMMAAGHPRIAFELDLFSSLQQHWNDDADYGQRKRRTDSVQLWAVGQAQATARSLDLFARVDFATDGIFPEFTFYDCHSCHRAIDDNPARERRFEVNPGRPVPFAQPPYNDENIIMLSAVAQVLAPAQAAQFDAAARAFHAAMGQNRAEAVAAANRLRGAATVMAQALAQGPGGGETAFRVVAAIGGRAISPRFTDYAGSAQAVMAVDTLLNAMVRDGRITIGAAAGIRANINRAYGAVSSPASYRPAAFRAALGEAVRSIMALQ